MMLRIQATLSKSETQPHLWLRVGILHLAVHKQRNVVHVQVVKDALGHGGDLDPADPQPRLLQGLALRAGHDRLAVL